MEKRKITVEEIAGAIDHSLLRPDLTVNELKEGCSLAKKYHCVSVCVRPSDIPIVSKELSDSLVLPTTVIGFPHGTSTTETKVFETIDAIGKGAVEVDVVMNIGRFLSGEYDYVRGELEKVTEAAHKRNALVKVIFENCLLTEEQIIKASEIARTAGADFTKTSTGYAREGAKVNDIKIMKEHCAGMKVKAAGGIKTLDQVLELMAAGALRVGTRSTEAILKEAEKRAAEGGLFIQI